MQRLNVNKELENTWRNNFCKN